jgi:hypothetical protein
VVCCVINISLTFETINFPLNKQSNANGARKIGGERERKRNESSGEEESVAWANKINKKQKKNSSAFELVSILENGHLSSPRSKWSVRVCAFHAANKTKFIRGRKILINDKQCADDDGTHIVTPRRLPRTQR